MTDTQTVPIPVPLVRPFGSKADKPEYVHEVWDVFVKPDQEKGIPQSVEMRLLMAYLRALHEGMYEQNNNECERCSDGSS